MKQPISCNSGSRFALKLKFCTRAVWRSLFYGSVVWAATQAQGQWVAINDVFNGPLTHANATTYGTVAGGVSVTGQGPLKDILTGADLSVTLTLSNANVNPAGSMGSPTAGTPAANIFGGYVDWNTANYIASSPQNAVYLDSTTDIFYITFSGLNPNKLYQFAGSAVRGDTTYGNRWTRVAIVGADQYTAAHQTGPGSPTIIDASYAPSGLGPNEAAFNSGHNQFGDVVAWRDINPGADGTITVVCSVYAGPYPPSGAQSVNNRAYGLNAIRLEEVAIGPVAITQQPIASTNAEAYSSVSLSVNVDGAGPQYQWYKGSLGEGTSIEGATGRLLNFPSILPADAGSYYVVVSNSLNVVTSEVALVTVFVNPIVITQQPTNAMTVLQLRPFTLSVAVTGTRPAYQWYHDSGAGFMALLDETNSTYSVASASAANGGTYRVVVTNLTSSQTSSNAAVTVTSDGAPPAIVRVVGNGFLNQVTVEFDEAVSADMGGEFATSFYTFTPELYVYNVVLTNDRTAILFTDPHPPGQTYALQVYAFDLVGNNGLANGSYTSWVPNRSGGVIFDVFAAGTGTAVSNLTNHASFPNAPTESYVLTNFSTTNLWPDVDPANTVANRQNYGGRLRGFFIPPVSGEWRLFLSSDDGSELWFNPTGPSADGKQRVAYETGCCNPFQEPGTATQTSLPFPLIAGQPYYVEALYKEQGGGDYCLVAARREGDPTASTNLVPIIDMGYANIPAGLVGVASFSQQPGDRTVEAPGGFTLTVAGTNTLNAPFNYQWQRSDGSGGFTNIPNATLNWISRTNLLVADSGWQYRCIVASGDSAATSQVATVTVTPDATGPTLLTAVRDGTYTNILLTFSEIVSDASATNVAHYTVCDVFLPTRCVTVLNAVLTNNGYGVLIETEVPDLAGVYSVSLNNVTDTNNNAVVPPASAVVGLTVSFQQGVNGYAGTVDTHVRSDNPTTAYAANVAVLADNASPLSHALLRFDNIFGSGAGLVPPGATILSATLVLRTDNWGNDTRVHRMLVPWEATNTWNTVGSPNDGVNINAGGDAVTTPEATFQAASSGTGTGEKRRIDVTASVRFWITNGSPNYGWALIDSGDDGYQFNSSEATTVDYRPQLLISFTPQATVSPVQIVADPAPTQTLNEWQDAHFTVTVSGTRPEAQWYKEGVAIPGATNLTLTIPSVVETNAGRYYCVITNLAPSQVTSADAFLVVNPDTNAPAMVSALATTNASQIRIVFSKAMSEASVTNIANYIVSPAFGGANLAILSASLDTNGTTVIVTTAPRDQFNYYQLTIQNVTDAAYRHNVITPNPTKLLLAGQIGLIAPDNNWHYNQDGVDLGTAWVATGYDDTAWSNGPALFVGKNGTPGNGDLPILTTLSLSNSSGGTLINTITYYFRQNFTMPSQAQLASLLSYHFQVRPILDDGAVFHINGQEARRVRMTNDPVVYSSYAQAPAQGNDYRYEGPYDLPTTNVVFGGVNTLAVEVHQINAGSSDVAFAAEVVINVPPPVMQIVPATLAGTTLQLTWPPVVGYQLEESDRVEGPYTAVAGNPQGTYNVNTTQALRKFYRLRSP